MPILFLTAKNGNSDLMMGYAAGGDDYLSKPSTYPDLIATLPHDIRTPLTKLMGYAEILSYALNICISDFQRICDNLSSNILKYASTEHPVLIKAVEQP